MNVHDNFLRIFKLLGPTDLGRGRQPRLEQPGLTRIERDNVVSLWSASRSQWKSLEAKCAPRISSTPASAGGSTFRVARRERRWPA